MIGSKKKGNNMDQMKNSNTSKLINSLVLETTVQGDVQTNNDIRIDGTLIGKLDCNGKVIIGGKGRVEGEIKCQNAVIEGEFKGSINVQELMVVEASARIEGDVLTDKLQVEPGAIYNVKCVMGGQQIKTTKPLAAE